MERHPKYKIPEDPDGFAKESLKLIRKVDSGRLSRSDVAWSISAASTKLGEIPQLHRAGVLSWDIAEFEDDGYPGEKWLAEDWKKVRKYIEDYIEGNLYPSVWLATSNYKKVQKGKVIQTAALTIRIQDRRIAIGAATKALRRAAESLQVPLNLSDKDLASYFADNIPKTVEDFEIEGSLTQKVMESEAPNF